MDRGPLGPPLPADAHGDRVAGRAAVGPWGRETARIDSATVCGICGIARLEGAADRGRLEKMAATLEHRGPDSDGYHVDGPVGLAARRLSIIDLEHGDQPIANEDGDVHVVQNGEIYNHAELRIELERSGHRFRTRCDTEMLVHAYEEWGDAFARRLRGMFAVAIWDARRRRLVLARDPFGIKPLLYRISSDGLEFASELRALPRGEIDPDAVDAFLAFNSIPAPLTIFRDVRKLPPGHVLVWEEGEARLERFARPAPVPADELRDGDDAELVEECRARLRDSVRMHLVSDVPVGVLLSGGVDSGLLAALTAEESRDPLRTFSIGFEESSFDELGDARKVAARYATDHHELVLRPDAARLLPALAEAFDEPFADSSALPTYLVSELASSHVKVALSGEGSDPVDVYRERFAETEGAELLARLQDVDERVYLVDDLLVKTDRASMAHSLEARVPFCDPVVASFAHALPTRHKIRGLRKKVLLRRAAEPLLPRSIVYGRKRGFSIPAAAWLRGELEPFARETLSAATLRRQGFFEPRVVERLIDDHVARREDRSRQLWGLLAFTLWHEHHVERTPGRPRLPDALAA